MQVDFICGDLNTLAYKVYYGQVNASYAHSALHIWPDRFTTAYNFTLDKTQNERPLSHRSFVTCPYTDLKTLTGRSTNELPNELWELSYSKGDRCAFTSLN